MPLDKRDIATIRDAEEELKLHNPPEDVRERVRHITDTIAERSKRVNEAKAGVFLSHFQFNGGPDMMALKSELEHLCPEIKVWYDKDEEPSPEEMRLGIKNSRYFLLYLTENVLMRRFCRKEIRWALNYKKRVVLLWKQEGPGAVASFANFFTDIGKQVDDDDGSGLVPILNTAAIPYYITGPFHVASMSELMRKLELRAHVSIQSSQLFNFPDSTTPALLLLYRAENGGPQVQFIKRELQRWHPKLIHVGI